jgi:hypothetical protein
VAQEQFEAALAGPIQKPSTSGIINSVGPGAGQGRCRLVGAGNQSDVFQKAKVRHDPSGRGSAAIEERQLLIDDDNPLPVGLRAAALKPAQRRMSWLQG